jgi:hypothetical protein
LAAAAVVLVASSIGLATGSGSTDLDGEIDPARWAAALEEHGTYRTSIVIDSGVSGMSMRTEIEGINDPATGFGRGTVRMTMPGVGADVSCTTISSTTEVFVEVPEDARAAFGGVRWLRMPLDDFPMPSGGPATFDMDALAGQSDVITELRLVGSEVLRGDRTRHYQGVMDMAAVVEQFSEQRPEMSFPDRVPTELWVDELDRVRRMTYETAMTSEAGEVTTSFTIESYDFGLGESVEAPPPGEVGEGGPDAFTACFSM